MVDEIFDTQFLFIFECSIEYGRIYAFEEAHRDAISCMDWNKDILATGSWDATVKIWQCNEINLVNLDHNLLAQLEHDSQVSALALCPDNRYVMKDMLKKPKIGCKL